MKIPRKMVAKTESFSPVHAKTTAGTMLNSTTDKMASRTSQINGLEKRREVVAVSTDKDYKLPMLALADNRIRKKLFSVHLDIHRAYTPR